MRPIRVLLAVPVLAASLLFGFAGIAWPESGAPSEGPKDPVYAALRAAKPDGRTLAVTNLVLERDVFRFEFASGTFHFLAPVEGRTIGAVFLGQGTFRLTPATPGERRRLALDSGGDPKTFETLTDSFTRLVLLFGDDTAAELQLAAPIQTGTPNREALDAWEAHMKRERKDYHVNFHLRILADLLDVPGLTSGAFLAFLEGQKIGPALAAVDPRGAEALGVGAGGKEDAMLYVVDETKGGSWYESESAAEIKGGRRTSLWRSTDATHYDVETAVARDEDVAGTTTIHFQVTTAKLRVLPVNLQPELRLRSARFAPEGEERWTALPFVQETEKEDANSAVIFPRTLSKGEKIRLELAYAGDKVLIDMGEKNYAVLSRVGWYPNLGFFTDPATFTLTYRVPVGNEIISVGNPVETRTEGKQTVSIWKAETPIQVAGFNYGKFKKHSKKDEISGIEVEVWTNPGTPDVVRSINNALDRISDGENDEIDPDGLLGPGTRFGEGIGNVNTEKLADSALADGLNSARLFTTYFGPIPATRVAITQQSQWTFGQSWPALIYMPYMSFLNGTQRQRVGLGGAKDFVASVGYHEFAHQWWGHLLGWESYRDQWLSEGFAEFSAALALQHTAGWGAYDKFWRESRKRILEKTPGNAFAPWEAGAIIDGYRSGSSRAPSAPFSLIYEKGGYVLHMLRMAMYDGRSKDPDAQFIAMMKDFTSTYAGKNPSTADFAAIVEKHLTPSLNATQDGKIAWFFNQWLYGNEMPKLTSDLKIEGAADGGWRIHGTITQAEVGPDFRTLVPIYLELDKGQNVQAGLLAMVGSATKPVDVVLKPPKKPRRAFVNARGEVLARD
ncbi:MAG: M1 family aminopeptidase [Acidobacteriota bacterium]